MSNNDNHGFTQSTASGHLGMPQEAPPSVKEWVLTLIILMIPLVNLIMMLVWAFGEGPKWRANFCKANLLIMVIALAVYFIIFLLFGSILLTSSMPN
ncbi:hypothetical protein AB8Q18_14290 [Neisseriaceae bacterium CLB008]